MTYWLGGKSFKSVLHIGGFSSSCLTYERPQHNVGSKGFEKSEDLFGFEILARWDFFGPTCMKDTRIFLGCEENTRIFLVIVFFISSNQQ